MKRMTFPEGKKFAFTIFDDTDHATVDNVKPIYELLLDLGIITTKSVWVFPINDERNPYYQSQTLSDPDYLNFIRWLVANRFEIAFHNASMGSSAREQTIAAIERFRELLGFYPNIHANHWMNRENLYWGQDRIDFPIFKFIMKLKRRSAYFVGHKPDSPFFWGDICQQYITYVRNFVFREINLLRVNPTMPYLDPKRPYVKYWFSSSEGGSVKSFNRLICPRNQERLEEEGGVCIVYTHFANGFTEKGKVNDETRKLLWQLSRRNGWFVPVSELLDYLRARQPAQTLSVSERITMELRWILTKLFYGTS